MSRLVRKKKANMGQLEENVLPLERLASKWKNFTNVLNKGFE